MDLRVHVEALREVLMMMSAVCLSRCARRHDDPNSTAKVFRDLANVLLVVLVLFAPTIVAALARSP